MLAVAPLLVLTLTQQLDFSGGCCGMVGRGSRPRNGGPTATLTSWPASAQARANAING
jgi:hypothetical protein